MLARKVASLQICLALSAICIFAFPRVSIGDPSAPNNFYQKNFANAPKVGGEAMVAPEQARVVPTSPQRAVGTSAPIPAKVEGNAAAQKTYGKAGEPKGIVTLYVSSQSRGHFESVVRKAFHLAESNRNIRLGGIYHIGDYRNVPPSVESDAKAKGVVLLGLLQVPPMWSVKDSPVWIIRDSNGEHVVEGLLNIERCVTPQGEYKEPESSMFAAPATPTMGVKNF